MSESVKRTRRNGNQDRVIAEGPEQVLGDIAQRRAAEVDGARDGAEVAAHEHDIRRFDGNIRPRPDREADIGGGERRRIVDAVANEGDFAVRGPQGLDRIRFAFRQDLRLDLVDAERAGDRLRRRLAVAGDHREAEPVLLQRG